jgi:DNA-binding CsgD family transcriptional regulator
MDAGPRHALVGRTAELATIRRLVDGTAAGRGGVLLVAGEAGIGKTRLLDEVAARAAERGLPVLSGRAVQGGGTYRAVAGAVIGLLDADHATARAAEPALRPYRAALGRLLPSWAGSGPPDGYGSDADPTVVLAEGLLRLLRLAPTTAPGCVLRLEDLHWADDDTLALVEHLATAAAGSPVLLACSARDDAPGGSARRLAAAPGTVTLRPARLTGPEVAALAAACRGGRPVPDEEARRLLDRSDGLPFAVEELVAAPGTTVPPTLATLVADRLAALPEPAREVLHAAAVLGPELDWRLLAPVTGGTEPEVLRALRAAAAQALLVADGRALRWPHALTREAVLDVLLPPERAALAAHAARVLGARAGPDDELRAAELFVEAGEPDSAARLLLRLARHDASRGALRSAEQHLAAAAATCPGAELAAAVAVERVAVLTQVGRAGDALALGTEHLGRLRGDAHAEMCLQLARTAIAAGDWTEAEGFVERAGRPSDPRSLVLRADAAFGAGRPAAAAELAAAAIIRAEETATPAALCEALDVASRAAWRVDLDVTEAMARRAAQVAGEHGLTPWRVRALTGLGMMEMLRHDDESTLRRARELATDAGMLGQVAAIEFVLSDQLWHVEGPRVGAEIVAPLADRTRPLRLPQLQEGLDSMARMLDVGARAAAGDAAAQALAARDRPAGRRASIGPEQWHIMQVLVALLEHDLPRAEAALAGGVTELLLDETTAPPLPFIGAWALLKTAVGDPDGLVGRRARTRPAMQVGANRGAFAYSDAIVHGRAGDDDRAMALLTQGDAELAGQPWWRRLLRTVVLHSAVVDRWGDPVPALRGDLAAHEQAGDTALARTCRDLLRRAGAPTRRTRGSTGVAPRLRARGVTAREAEVLGLVTRGMTNAQIAKKLFLSPRTVDTHVANLLAKTGAAARAELRDWAEEGP